MPTVDSTPAALKLPDLSECWELVERIASSNQLRRSTRLRELLLFVCRRHLKEGCNLLHEQQIGIEVFGRPETYDTNVDNIVRANMSELRKRLEAYFENEGSSEVLSLEMPRGSYIPVFNFRPQPASRPPESPAPQHSAAEEHGLPAAIEAPNLRHKQRSALLSWRGMPLLLGMGVVLAVLLVQNLELRRSLRETQHAFYPWRDEPTVAAFWSNFLETPQDTDVLVPDASFSQAQSYSRTSISLHDYIDRSYIRQLENTNLPPEARSILGTSTNLNFVTLSAVKMAHNILALDPLNKKMHLYFSREYIPSFIDRDNIILLGDPRSNPWVQLLENRLNFQVVVDHGQIGPIYNRAPRPGEQATYQPTDSEGYCVVAFLPNPGHSTRFLLIQGSNPTATEAAEFFLMNEASLASFQKKLNVQKFPYFEVLLKTSQVTGTPLMATVEAYRVHSEQ